MPTNGIDSGADASGEQQMSFFAENAEIGGGGGFVAAPQGVYLCNLADIEIVDGTAFNDPGTKTTDFKWIFETVDDTDEEGNPYRFVKFTGRRYGDDRANLTTLLDQMMGRRLTDDEFKALDLPKLRATQWRVMVDEYTNAKGFLNNKIMSVKPAVAPRPAARPQAAPAPQRPQQRRPSPPPDNSDIQDPFAE